MERILLIDDDPAMQKALKLFFERENYAIDIAGDGRAGLDAFHASQPDLVILDLMLPKVRGEEVCREIKAKVPTQPLIVMSARCEEVDKVLLLELGADDYVTKPFSLKELLARVHAVIRSHAVESPAVFRFEDVYIDFWKMEIVRGGKPILLTANEFRLMRHFCKNSGRVISRDELLRHMHPYTSPVSTRTVDYHVMQLRQKLERNPEQPMHFITVHRVGYKFVG